MVVTFHGRNCDITEKFRQHAEPRVDTLENFFDRIGEVRVNLSGQRSWKTVEITLEADGILLRAEERTNDELASFDKALDRLERQLRRYRDRVKDHTRQPFRKVVGEQAEETEEVEVEEVDAEDLIPTDLSEINIVRTKAHPVKPMTPTEAALQMEMLGHDFFVFVDGGTQRVGVVYRRRDGDYGLIEPQF